MSIETIQLLSPEIVLIVAAVSIYVAGAFVDSRYLWGFAAAAGIAAAAGALLLVQEYPAPATDPVSFDSLACYGRWLALAIGALFVLLAFRPLDTPGTPEYVGSLLLAGPEQATGLRYRLGWPGAGRHCIGRRYTARRKTSLHHHRRLDSQQNRSRELWA